MAKGISKVSQKEKIPVTFNGEQLKIIEKYTGIMGNTRAEIIRNIVINWLLEKGLVNRGKNV